MVGGIRAGAAVAVGSLPAVIGGVGPGPAVAVRIMTEPAGSPRRIFAGALVDVGIRQPAGPAAPSALVGRIVVRDRVRRPLSAEAGESAARHRRAAEHAAQERAPIELPEVAHLRLPFVSGAKVGHLRESRKRAPHRARRSRPIHDRRDAWTSTTSFGAISAPRTWPRLRRARSPPASTG